MPSDTDTLASDGLNEPVGAASTVVTRMMFSAPPEQVWHSLLFYEEVKERPPLCLRLVLPMPIRIEGDKSGAGGKTKCIYEDGHLVKRTTRIVQGTLYEFQVAEQELAIGGTMRLHGGCYTLQEVDHAHTEVAIETRYTSAKWPRWFWQPLEYFVCHLFHRFLLGSMRRKVERS